MLLLIVNQTTEMEIHIATLVCEYGLNENQVYDVQWFNSDVNPVDVLFSKAVTPRYDVKGTPLEDRGVSWTYTDTSHSLTIPQVNIITDAMTYRCFVLTKRLESGNSYLNMINKIYSE